ncbi:MAG: hypothetical protein IJ438_04195, partial [Clostridia bacterium]|nr:hypothetical protein [Clostridia bacterium]
MRKVSCFVIVLLALFCLMIGTAWADPLVGDEAHIIKFRITECIDGTAAFDGDDTPGNDSSEKNGIVRSFDMLTYTLYYDMMAHDEITSFTQARVSFAFVLPCSSDEAEFSVDSMRWMDASAGYEYEIVEEANQQTLYCSYLMTPTEGGYIIPGFGSVNVSIYVKGMKNGATLQPRFYAWLDGNDVHTDDWDSTVDGVYDKLDFNAVCTDHPTHQEMWTTDGAEVTVSAKLQMNVLLRKLSSLVNNVTYDFNVGSETDNKYGIGKVTGMATTLSIGVQLYGDNKAKGLRGIEYPEGDITFDINLSGTFKKTNSNEVIPLKGEGYDFSPIMYFYFKGRPSVAGERGTSIPRSLPFPTRDYPGYTTTTNNSCCDGGTWSVIQENNVLHVTISDYKIDGVFPRSHDNPGIVAENYFDENIGFISVADIRIVIPNYNILAGGTNGEYDDYIVKCLGDGIGGAVTLTVNEGNLSAVSASGARLEPATDTTEENVPGVNNQMIQNDDARDISLEFGKKGSAPNLVIYVKRFEMNNTSSYTDGCSGNGRDWAYQGAPIGILSGVTSVNTFGEDQNYLVGMDTFIKIDGDVIKLADEYQATGPFGSILTPTLGSDGLVDYYGPFPRSVNNDSDREKLTRYEVLLAVKTDGKNWTNDEEMRSTTQDSSILKYYKNLSDAEAAGVIVGVLFQVRGDITYIYPRFGLLATVADDAEIDSTVMLTNTMRFWSRRDLNEINASLPDEDKIDEIPVRTVDYAGYAESAYAELYKENSYYVHPRYYRTVYHEDGTISGDCREGGTTGHIVYQYGDTLYIAGYETKISLDVANATAGSDGTLVYNLDSGQYVADFALTPTMNLGKVQDNATGTVPLTSVTVTQTLPAGLSYIYGSSYWGGTYESASEAGRQGTVTDGLHLSETRPVSYDYTYTIAGEKKTVPIAISTKVQENIDGTTTIQYVFDNVPLLDSSIGTSALTEKIYFSTSIAQGTSNQWMLEEQATITGDAENRAFTTANGNLAIASIIVLQNSAEGIGEKVDRLYNEIEGDLGWTITYSNNASDARTDALLLSVLPREGFDGTYVLSDWALDVSADAFTQEVLDTLKLYYYTGDLSGKDAGDFTLADMTAENGWTAVTLKVQAGKLVPESYQGFDHATGWCLTGTLPASSVFSVYQGVTPDGNTAGNSYQNVASFRTKLGNGLACYASVYVIGREISGVAWFDANQNGLRDEDQKQLLAGVEATLEKKQDNGEYAACTNVKGENVDVITTEADGTYRFENLAAGEYRVVFGGNVLKNYSTVTAFQVDDSEKNNDAVIAGGQYVIQDISLSSIESINQGTVALEQYQEVVDHQDIGLIQNGDLTISKTVTGDITEAEQSRAFSFTLKLTLDGAAITQQLTTAQGQTLTAQDGVYPFTLTAGQSITIKDLPAGAEYSVREIAVEHYTATKEEFAETIVFAAENKAAFENHYQPDEALFAASVTKTITGRSESGKDFEFALKLQSAVPEDGVNMKTGDQKNTTITGAGTKTFDNITFTRAGTYTFELTEVKGTAPGYAYDESIWMVTVTVTDEAGKLTASTEYSKVGQEGTASKATFENVYSATGSVTFEGRKHLEGRELTEDDVFTFEVRETVEGKTKVVSSGSSDISGKITYTEIPYSLSDVGVHTYTVVETSKNGAGITVATNTHTV